MLKYYAGIGSRETPQSVLELMTELASCFEKEGFILRSGGAIGADTAFDNGISDRSKRQLFLPWPGYNGIPEGVGVYSRFVSSDIATKAMQLAEAVHPNWPACSPGARKMHARNGLQIMGPKLDELSSFVICWTKGGTGAGGTGQAIRLAKAASVPVFDLGKPRFELVLRELNEFVNNLMNQGVNP